LPADGLGHGVRWHDLSLIDLANGHLVEDLKLGLDLCRNGKPPAVLPEAQVYSQFPLSDEGLNTSVLAGSMATWAMLADAPGRWLQSLARRKPGGHGHGPAGAAGVAGADIDGLLVTWLAYLLFGLAAPAWLALPVWPAG
jgi:hypothetical protein